MWKPLASSRVLETSRGSSKGKAQRGQYLLTVGLGRYKWYKSQILGDVPVRRMSPEEGWTQGGVPARTLAPKGGRLGESTSIGEENECQQGRWSPKEVSVGEKNVAFFISMWKLLPSKCVLKTLRKSPKRIIYASGGLGPLQIKSYVDSF